MEAVETNVAHEENIPSPQEGDAVPVRDVLEEPVGGADDRGVDSGSASAIMEPIPDVADSPREGRLEVEYRPRKVGER